MPNHYFVLESKEAISKAHDVGFNSFLVDSAFNRIDIMLTSPQWCIFIKY